MYHILPFVFYRRLDVCFQSFVLNVGVFHCLMFFSPFLCILRVQLLKEINKQQKLDNNCKDANLELTGGSRTGRAHASNDDVRTRYLPTTPVRSASEGATSLPAVQQPCYVHDTLTVRTQCRTDIGKQMPPCFWGSCYSRNLID